MKKVTLIVFFISLLITGCSTVSPSKLSGVWFATSGSAGYLIEFNEDGTALVGESHNIGNVDAHEGTFTYTLDGDHLYLKNENAPYVFNALHADIKIDGNTMVFDHVNISGTDRIDLTFEKIDQSFDEAYHSYLADNIDYHN